jgi:hypothetical protein
LVLARLFHPRPHELEIQTTHLHESESLSQAYWIYFSAGALIAAGLSDFALIGFHFQKTGSVPVNLVPVFYAIAMATSALSALVLGRLFDRWGEMWL